jgi:hypothetical protein
MILSSFVPRAVGSVFYSRVNDSHGLLSQEVQPLYVVREATHAEWEAGIRADGGIPWGPVTPFYYEISTD